MMEKLPEGFQDEDNMMPKTITDFFLRFHYVYI